MNIDARLLVLPFAFLLVACGNQVIGGASDDGGAGGGTSTNSGGAGSSGGNGTGADGGAGGSGQGSLGVAMSREQLDLLWEEYWQNNPGTGSTTVGVGGGGSGDMSPDDMFIQISDLGAVCTSPTVELPCGGHWSLSIALPPYYQEVGVYSLDDAFPSTYSSMYETGELNSSDPEDCPVGGGSTGSGTVEILSIDDSELHIVLTMEQGLWDNDPSGDYIIPRCQ